MLHPFLGILILAANLTTSVEVVAGPRDSPYSGLRITILFNNVTNRHDLTSGWGFSCLIEGLENTTLFDTGSDGAVLLSNMKLLGLSPKSVEVIVLSHNHADHTGGIDRLLAENAEVVEIFLPAGFPASFKKSVTAAGTRVRTVRKGAKLLENVYSTKDFIEGGLGAVIEMPPR